MSFVTVDKGAMRLIMISGHRASEGPDGTLPAWSTRLLGNPNVVTLKGDIEHMDLMNDAAVQVEIADLLNPTPQALRRMHATAKTMKMKTASRAKLNELLEGLRAVTAVEGLRPEQRKEAVLNYLRQFSPDKLQEFLGRAYLDALKSPSQIYGSSGGRKTKKPKRRAEPRRK
jgi:hypothetical protein